MPETFQILSLTHLNLFLILCFGLCLFRLVRVRVMRPLQAGYQKSGLCRPGGGLRLTLRPIREHQLLATVQHPHLASPIEGEVTFFPPLWEGLGEGVNCNGYCNYNCSTFLIMGFKLIPLRKGGLRGLCFFGLFPVFTRTSLQPPSPLF